MFRLNQNFMTLMKYKVLFITDKELLDDIDHFLSLFEFFLKKNFLLKNSMIVAVKEYKHYGVS